MLEFFLNQDKPLALWGIQIQCVIFRIINYYEHRETCSPLKQGVIINISQSDRPAHLCKHSGSQDYVSWSRSQLWISQEGRRNAALGSARLKHCIRVRPPRRRIHSVSWSEEWRGRRRDCYWVGQCRGSWQRAQTRHRNLRGTIWRLRWDIREFRKLEM